MVRRVSFASRRKGPRRFTIETLEPRRLLAGDIALTGAALQNQSIPLDINGDGVFAAGDVAALVIALNTKSGGEGEPAGNLLYTDVDGDGDTAPSDALASINYINSDDDVYGEYYPGGESSGSSGSLSFPAGNPIIEVLEYEEFKLPLVAEGDFAYLTVEWLDPDGSPPEYWYPGQDIWHIYHDDYGLGTPSDEYGVTVRGYDWYGDEIASVFGDIRIHNRLPSILGVDVNPQSVVEAGTVQVEVRYQDDSWYDEVTVEIDWGDGSPKDTVTRQPFGFYSPSGYDGEHVVFAHTYVDDEDDEPHLEYKDYEIKVSVVDDDTGTALDQRIATVVNADPTIAIDSIEAIDRVLADGTILNAGKVDESEGFRVKGTVTDLGAFDVHTGYVKADLNFDGDYTDSGETIEIGGSGTHWTFDIRFTNVPDDGPFGGNPTNFTTFDLLQVHAFIEDDDGGSGSISDTVFVYNVAPVFTGLPQLDFILAEDNTQVLSARVSGSFDDVGTKDWHKIALTYTSSILPSVPQWLPPGVSSFSISVPILGPLVIYDFENVRLDVSDDDFAVISYGFSAVQITTKSFINGMVAGTGGFPIGDNPQASNNANVRLTAFGAATAAVFQENPQYPNTFHGNRSILSDPSEFGESYRLFSRINLIFGYEKGAIVDFKLVTQQIDGGTELPFLFAGTVNLIGPNVQLVGGKINATWMTHGHPAGGAEPSFNAVALRQAKTIWHLLDLDAMATDTGVKVAVDLRGSKFPSHRTWINGSRELDISQGKFVNLWEEVGVAAAIGLSQSLGVPTASFSGFVTEEEDGNYVTQASPIPIEEGYWNPEYTGH